MSKFVFAAIAMAAALFTINPSSAKAGTDIQVFLGVGGSHAGVHGIHYRGHRFGHRRFGHRHYRKHHRASPRRRIVRKMHRRGFYDCHNVRRRGHFYKMRCFRNDRLFRIKANARNGRIVKRRRIH